MNYSKVAGNLYKPLNKGLDCWRYIIVPKVSEEFITEFNQIYELKKQGEELIYKMNDFCSKWDGNLTISEIPYLIKLFDDDCSTSEQNEFIAETIRSIYEKSPLDMQ